MVPSTPLGLHRDASRTFVRSSFPAALQPCRIYAQGHEAVYSGKTNAAPTTSPIKFVILLIKSNNVHISNLPVGAGLVVANQLARRGRTLPAGAGSSDTDLGGKHSVLERLLNPDWFSSLVLQTLHLAPWHTQLRGIFAVMTSARS